MHKVTENTKCGNIKTGLLYVVSTWSLLRENRDTTVFYVVMLCSLTDGYHCVSLKWGFLYTRMHDFTYQIAVVIFTTL